MTLRVTAAERRSIQQSAESVRVLARRFELSTRTVQKWRKRPDIADRKRGPRPRVLTPAMEGAVLMFRRQTLLPLDDCFYALQTSMPGLSRSALHRYFQRKGLSALSEASGFRSAKVLGSMPIGYFHLGVHTLDVCDGQVHMFVAFDRISKLAFGRSRTSACPTDAIAFLQELVRDHPFTHTVLTSDERPFVARGRVRGNFAQACAELGVEHRIIAFNTPRQPRGETQQYRQADREFATLESVAARFEKLSRKYNETCRLKALGGLTPLKYARRHYAPPEAAAGRSSPRL